MTLKESLRSIYFKIRTLLPLHFIYTTLRSMFPQPEDPEPGNTKTYLRLCLAVRICAKLIPKTLRS